MKKNTLAVWSCAILAAAVLAGCSSKKATEATTAPVQTTETPSTEAPTEPEEEKELKMDMVVAGGSGAGLIAAIRAVEEGADPSKVLVIEASGELGADLADLEEFINAADTKEQFDEEIDDSYEQFLADIKAAGNGKNEEELAEYLSESGEEALEWLRAEGIEMEGVEKEKGHSASRSYYSAGEKDLQEALLETLTKKIEDLKIRVMTDTEVKEVLFGEDGSVAGAVLSGKDGEKTVECVSLVLADEKLLTLLEKAPVQFTAGADTKNNGLLVNNCAEVLNRENEESILGLYAVGALIDPAVHGEGALAGNGMTATVVFGITAGTEAGMYAKDNKVD